MHNFKLKLKDILLPHICVAFAATLTHLFFYYLLILKLEINIRDIASKYIIPGMLIIAAIIKWVAPGIARLRFKNNRVHVLYYYISGLSIFWLCIASTNLLTLETNSNVIVDNVSEIGQDPKSIYYTINNHVLSKEHLGFSYYVDKIHNRSKKDSYTYIELYFASPICKPNTKINNVSNYSYWVMNTFIIRESKDAKPEEIDMAIQDFKNEFIKEFSKKTFSIDPRHFERIKYPEGIDYMRAAIEKVTHKPAKDVIMLKPCYSDLPDKAPYVLQMFISFFLGTIILFILLIFPEYSVKQNKKSDEIPPSSE